MFFGPLGLKSTRCVELQIHLPSSDNLETIWRLSSPLWFIAKNLGIDVIYSEKKNRLLSLTGH